MNLPVNRVAAGSQGIRPRASLTLQVSEIFATYAPAVYRVLRRWGAGVQDAEDLCQEVFVVVQRRVGDFQGRSSMRTWLFSIARHVYRNHRRLAVHRREQYVADISEPAAEFDPIRAMQSRNDMLRLDRALSKLRDEEREVFVLYEIEQLTLAQISAVTDAPTSTVHSRLQSARRQIRRAFLVQAEEDGHES